MSFNLAEPNRTVHVGVILTGGETEILDVAPIDLLHGMTPDFIKYLPLPDALKAQAIDFDFHWITESGKPANLSSGAKMQATHSFANAPPLDIALMGAHNPGYNPSGAELAFIRKVHDDCSAFLTICGGFDNVLRAGLLAGKTATAPRFILDKLRTDAPDTNWIDGRWAHDGKMWTSGALLCGPDMMRAFISETWSNKPELTSLILDVACCPDRGFKYEK